jgi:uncharacterized protein (TIGR03435 family)
MTLRILRMIVAGGILAIGAGLGLAQTTASAPAAPATFEVATIKPSDPTNPIAIRSLPDGRFVTSNTSLRRLITWAYDIGDDRLVGAPSWLDSPGYDVVAKGPSGHLPHGQLQLMVQALLADRVNLRVHWEHRQLPLYRLEMDSSGPKVHVLDAGTAVSQDPFSMAGLGRLSGTHVTTAMLAKVLTGQLGRYVDDKTGFNSVFDFTLVWRPDDAPAADASADEDARPSIFTAVREQLGFRLVPGKGSVEVVAIDAIDRHPTAN